jgi:hypothetical protein
MKWRLRRPDLLYLVETLMPQHTNRERTVDLIQDDDRLVESMLDDERLFRRLMATEDVLVRVSPWLFFTVLLRRTQRDMERESFTVERRNRQKVVLFDTDRVLDLLSRELVRDYLAMMLASFTRIESMTMSVEVTKGVWRTYRTDELNVEGLMRYSETTGEPFRFEPYKRIGDVCLFLTSFFPEYIEAQCRYPSSRQLRPRARGRVCASRDDYEAMGRMFYRLAAEHEMARMEGLDGVLAALSEEFVLAEKPLRLLADRYLQLKRHALFGL